MKPNDYSQLAELCPPEYDSFSLHRPSGRGGGLAAVYKKCYKCIQLPVNNFTSFEVLLFKFCSTDPVLCAVIYRPPKPNPRFLSEFSEFLPSIIMSHNRIVITGDFNIHFNNLTHGDSMTTEFKTLLENLDFTQHVTDSTHRLGNTLDLVMSKGLDIANVSVTDYMFSDHFGVF